MPAVTYCPGPDDPATVEWSGVLFRANVPQEVGNPHILRKALGNPFFAVEGEAGAPELDEKDDLVAKAEALGIDVDKRWGAHRLRLEIEKAKA